MRDASASSMRASRRTTAKPTQKPAAHLCGRVLGEAIHCRQNTMSHWTSQATIKLVLHRSRGWGELLRESFAMTD
jgi:hypothetical protein